MHGQRSFTGHHPKLVKASEADGAWSIPEKGIPNGRSGSRARIGLEAVSGRYGENLIKGKAANGNAGGLLSIWLPIDDTFRTFCLAPPPQIRVTFEQMCELCPIWAMGA